MPRRFGLGRQVEAEIQSLPGEIYTGRVAFIDPMVDDKTANRGGASRNDQP